MFQTSDILHNFTPAKLLTIFGVTFEESVFWDVWNWFAKLALLKFPKNGNKDNGHMSMYLLYCLAIAPGLIKDRLISFFSKYSSGIFIY